jgi:hypothetical protein
MNKLHEKLIEVSKKAQSVTLDKIFIPEHVSEERLNICLGCEHLYKPTKTCKKCGCFMEAKTKLFRSKCPIGKWGIYEEVENIKK